MTNTLYDYSCGESTRYCAMPGCLLWITISFCFLPSKIENMRSSRITLDEGRYELQDLVRS